MADTQLGMEASFARKSGWDKEIELVHLAAQEVNRLKPAFAIVCGDLVNEWPSDEVGRKSDAKLREQQIADFKKAFSVIDKDIPLVCLCGNHDVGDRPNPLRSRVTLMPL